jgi:eukaryotic-like serine/threonine-protein kinase
MELVEGPTLAERLEKGALPLDESLSIARQIAEALEEAHEKGIIHRDLKPQNIKASIEGKVKVLDFGLAKAMDPAGASGVASASQLAASPTLTLGATVQGVILGTAAYMSPEQAAGGVADRRSDVWSFGVVLYEMLVGRRLFDGETVSHVLAGVLKDEPDFSLLPADLPPRVRRLVRRCLRKRPRERLQAIGDARLVLDEVISGATDEAVPGDGQAAAVAAPPPRLWPLRAGLAALALATLGLGSLVVLDRPPAPKVVRATVPPPPERSFYLDSTRPGPIALSPDGRQIAFTASDADGRRTLWVRSLDTLEARELPGTDEAAYPFWSPDSQQIAFFTGSHLKKIALAGGPAVSLARASNGKGGAWSPRGVIVFTPEPAAPLSVVAAAGGEARPLTSFVEAAGDSSHRHPRFLPDGEHFLFVARRSGGDGGGGAADRCARRLAAGDAPRDRRQRRVRLRAAALPARNDADGATVRRPPPPPLGRARPDRGERAVDPRGAPGDLHRLRRRHARLPDGVGRVERAPRLARPGGQGGRSSR